MGQKAAHDAEIAALLQEQRRNRRRAKLDLLAQIAPHGTASVEDVSLASSPAPSTRDEWDTSLHLSGVAASADNSRISITGGRTCGTRRPSSVPRISITRVEGSDQAHEVGSYRASRYTQ